MATKSEKSEKPEKISVIINFFGILKFSSENPGKKTFLLLTIGGIFILSSIGLVFYFLQSYALPFLASALGGKMISNLVRMVKALKPVKLPVKPNILEKSDD